MILSNYELIEKIAESSKSTIFKACHKKNSSKLLIIKLLKNYLSENKKTQIRQKIEHLKTLNDSLLITPIAFTDKEGACFITQDYFDGITLDTLKESKISLQDFFEIACKLAFALGKAHDAGIIHGGIKPHNILVNKETLDIRLIDFISAIDVRDVSHFIFDPTFIKDTLAYTSPEQTGRINHRVVFSSDLYSAGIVFYEMLTGRLPFLSDDPLELIHQHLAREAPKVHDLNPDVPLALSNIISKLMFKEPEKRYQGSKALFDDLMRCKKEFTATGTITDFPLEKSVHAHRVTFISKMVGREDEAELILSEYEKVARGEFRSLFISGLSGIGKTRLIQELQKPIVKHRGYFTSGKFDVYQKNIPYSSLIQALSNLMRTFLTESDERVVLWKNKILNAVGQNGKVLTDVIPELEILIGTQPEVQKLPPVESLNRFHDVFDRFLACLASEENPLTLFIDDLQWCDVASFDFLSNLFTNYKDHPFLFLIGAYRYNEVDSSHPLSKLIKNIKETNQPLKEVRLGPLKPEHCHEMVSYILDSSLEQTQSLAGFVSTLTEGNPLFVSESLSYLHNEDLLYVDSENLWHWDIEKIRSSKMPTTVVALFSSKIQKFNLELRTLLEYCACMGNTFSPAELSLIRETLLVEIFEILKPALSQGLLIENKSQLQFVHDKVQEAALAAIPESRRRQIHWQVGNHLLFNVPENEDIEKVGNLFTIVAHLNLGKEVPDIKTAYLLSDLNYYAGNKALNSLATEAANEYFNLSKNLLPQNCWDDAHYKRTFRIYQKAAKTELMCGNYEKSEKLLTELLNHAKTDLDKAECLAEQTTSLSSIGNFIKAIETANRGLAYFNKAIPNDPDEAEKRRIKLMNEIASKNIDIWETILNMPFTRDRRNKIELAFYSELIPDLYMSGLVPQLYLSAAQSTQHCLSGGMDESVIYSFSIMGLQLGEQEHFKEAFKYEDLARNLSAKYPNTFGATRGMNGIVWCNMHSRSHPKQIVDYCLKSIQCGKNCGDLYNAGLSYGPLMWNLQVQGADFSAIEEYAKECLHFSNRYHLSFSVGLAEAMMAGWVEPMKANYSPTPMEDKIAQWEKDNHIASAGSYFVHIAMVQYYCGNYTEAQHYLESVKKYLSGLTDNVLKRQWFVFRVLNILKLYEKGIIFNNKQELLVEIQPIIKKIETWANLGPLLKPYLAFIYAELERVTGDFKEARSLYLDAIYSAHEQEYTFLEGHLNECFAEFLHNRKHPAKSFFIEAERLYRECNAERKQALLLMRYPECFEEEKAVLQQIDVEPSYRSLPALDAEYLMRLSVAISAEIEQKALLKKILNIVIESSGAQHGYLITEEDGNLIICAESHAADKELVKLVNRKLEKAHDVCKAIIRYVHRSGKRVILNDAIKEGDFKDNLEVQNLKLRSVLCLPMVKQSKTVGILYLENRLSSSVFTSIKTDTLELLMSQAAISLENATLFEERKKAEEALRKSEQRWVTTLSSIGDAVIATDVSGKITFLNRVAEELTGWTLTEALQKPVQEVFNIINEHTRQEVESPVVKVLEKGMIVGLANHTILVRKDGAEIPIDDSGAPIMDREGKTTGVVLVFRDITERKKAEEELRQSEIKFRTVASFTQDWEYWITPDWEIVYASPSCKKITGYCAEEFIKNPHLITKIIHPDDRLIASSHFNNIEIKELPNIDFRIITRNGEIRWISHACRPVFDNEGKWLGRRASNRDITKRKKVEQALQKAKSDWERTFNSVPDFIAILDSNHRIVRVNQAMAKQLGMSPEQCIGLQCYGCVHGTDSPPSFCPHKKALQDGLEHVEEVHEPRLGGDFVVSATPLMDDKGHVIGSVHVARNITMRKQMEKKLEEYSKHLERLVEEKTNQLRNSERLAAIGQTAGMVGHDIRNPLQSIMGEVYLMKTDVDALSDNEDKQNLLESLQCIHKNVEYINKIVADLQDFAKPLNPVAEEVDLEETINEILHKLDMPQNIQVSSKVSSDAKKVISDTTCIKRVLGNLMLNAIQAMPNGGKLLVNAFHENTNITITVTDTGIGIPEEIKPKLFQPMFTTKSKGQGFGLVVIKRMVEALSGTVSFESEVGKGTKFIIKLPATK